MPKKEMLESVARETLRVDVDNTVSRLGEKLHEVHFVFYGIVKRGFDLLFSTIFLVLLTPLFVIVAVVIKLDSKGPAFFKQKRTGKDGKEFYILKFRSMVADNDVMDKSREDEYTRVGNFIRRTSIDELPQFVNVFLGQMSFIGPRPWVPEYYSKMNDDERMRCKVRPGITGLAAAKGRNGLTVFEKIAYDLEYVRNFSLWQDVEVVLLTFKQLMRAAEVNNGKSGIHNEIEELSESDKGPKARIIVKADPWVSVVVPLKSGEEYINEIVGTAVGHSCRGMELVVVNNDYTDEVRQIMSSFSPERIKITKPEDSGRKLYEMLDGEEGRFLCVVESRKANA